ncbi:melanin-concentrating hormone receptor 1-like isoform X1 [Haliotis asinina]|uniref:melanin-concentrating hormone receptor 1-like isoform X1 n=2 Tax=Haliotis asinina TaxID=109174 RepID=UPI0035319238
MAQMQWRELERAIADKRTGSLTTWHATYIVWLTLAMLIIGSHLFFIVLILAKRTLRMQLKNLLIVNICLVNLMMGGFIMPTVIHLILDSSEDECVLRMTVRALNDYLQPALSVLTAIALVIDRFLFIMQKPVTTKWLRIVVAVVLMIMPWVIGVLLALPLFFKSFEMGDPEMGCVQEVNLWNIVCAHVICFVLPSIPLFILATLSGLCSTNKKKIPPKELMYDCRDKPISFKGESIKVVVLVCFMTIFPEVPYFVISLLRYTTSCDQPYCLDFFQALKVSVWLRAAKALVFPFIWLWFTDIKSAIICRPTGAADEEDDDISDDQPTDMSQQDTMLLRYR